MADPILVDASLTGGRGPAKQAFEFILTCRERGVPYRLLTNRSFVPKLAELGVTADVIVDAELSMPRDQIYERYRSALTATPHRMLVKFGARTASTFPAWELGIPFVVVDGGLPDVLEAYPSLYAAEGYTHAQCYVLTTHFPWRFPTRRDLPGIVLATYPFSAESIAFCRSLRDADTDATRRRAAEWVPELGRGDADLTINLAFTGEYLTNPLHRVTYGAWLTARQHDQSVGYLRRLVTDLARQRDVRISLIMDADLLAMVDDVVDAASSLSLVANRRGWNYRAESLLRRAADVVITRATNYVPDIAMMGQGGLITAPVPADGYMDEDTAGYQALALGLTEFIAHDCEDYAARVMDFANDRAAHRRIGERLSAVSDEMVASANACDIVLSVAERMS